MATGGAGEITLRVADERDWPLIRRWLRRPDVEAWWGPASATEAEVRIAMTSGDAICRIVMAEDAPIGYAHAIDAATWGQSLPDELEPGTWDLDLFIAAEAHRGRGAGHRALELLKDEVFSTTLAVAVCIFASVRNERAARAFETAGFRWRRIWTDPVTGPVTGPEWFMVAERPRR